MRRSPGHRYLVFAGMACGLIVGAITACGSPAPPVAGVMPQRSATTAGFAGYKWQVVSIGHVGKTTSIAAKYRVYLEFTPDGQFGANEPVNFHSGTYKVTPGGFTTGELASTLAGYAGGDPIVTLSVDAISAFDSGTHATARMSGNTLRVTVGGYTLTAHRDGARPNQPAPQRT